MQALAVLRDSVYFFFRNIVAIARLCLPLIVVQALAVRVVHHFVGEGDAIYYEAGLTLAITPVYTCALLLYLDARHRTRQISWHDLWSATRSRLASFIGLTLLQGLISTGSLVVLAGCAVLIVFAFTLHPPLVLRLILLVLLIGTAAALLTSFWLTLRLSLAGPLLISRDLGPIAALRSSFTISRGHLRTLIASLSLAALAFILIISPLGLLLHGSPHPVEALLAEILLAFMYLIFVVVIYRLYTRITAIECGPPLA